VLLPTYTAFAQAPTVQWERSFGGSQADALNTAQLTLDGGFILGGASNSGVSGDRSQSNQGVASDYWIVKLGAAGLKEWDRRFGGAQNDELWSVLQTADGGYLLGGTSFSGIGGDKTQAGQGNFDYWVVKLDAQGNKQWDRAYGGSEGEILRSLQQTSDGGYILGGYSGSGITGDKTQPNRADPAFPNSTDYWIIKIDVQGNKQWDRTFGGNATEFFSEIQQTTDGGYILGGSSLSDASEDRTDVLRGVRDYWMVKIDAQGHAHCQLGR